MINFHEHKLWQDAYVVLMDIHEVIEDSDPDLLAAAQKVAAMIADGLSRLDRRVGRDLVLSAVGLVAVARTQLAVVWGRGLVDDETFKKLDDKYQTLSEALQNFR